MVQSAIVALIVGLAFAYTAWALMPAAWQRGLRRRLGLAAPVDAGGCSSCGGGCAAPRKPGPPERSWPSGLSGSADQGPSLAVVTLHRRLPVQGKASGKA